MWGPNTASWSSLQNIVGVYTFSTVYCTSVSNHHLHHLRSPQWAPCWGLVGLLQGHSEHFGPHRVSYVTHHGRHEWTMFFFMVSTMMSNFGSENIYFSTFTFLQGNDIFSLLASLDFHLLDCARHQFPVASLFLQFDFNSPSSSDFMVAIELVTPGTLCCLQIWNIIISTFLFTFVFS